MLPVILKVVRKDDALDSALHASIVVVELRNVITRKPYGAHELPRHVFAGVERATSTIIVTSHLLELLALPPVYEITMVMLVITNQVFKICNQVGNQLVM